MKKMHPGDDLMVHVSLIAFSIPIPPVLLQILFVGNIDMRMQALLVLGEDGWRQPFLALRFTVLGQNIVASPKGV